MKPTLLLPILATLFISLASVTSSAQDVSKKEMLAGQLLDELNMQKMMDSTFDAIPKMQQQMMGSQKMTPEQQDKFNKQMQTSMQSVKKLMGWDTIKPMFVKIYADNFDEGELRGLIDFYKTPVGQAWIQKQPQIQAATMQAMSQIMPKIQAEMMKSLTQSEAGASPAP